MGRVVRWFPGPDGIVRLVVVRTKNGELLRPIQRLYSLEISDDDVPAIQSVLQPSTLEIADAQRSMPTTEMNSRSRFGRLRRCPARYLQNSSLQACSGWGEC